MYQDKQSKWTRTPLADGSMRQRITPTDDSGERIVRFLGAHSWQNDPNDDRANIDIDRVVLISGNPLPDFAIDWLTRANAKNCASGRRALQNMIADADFAGDSRDGW